MEEKGQRKTLSTLNGWISQEGSCMRVNQQPGTKRESLSSIILSLVSTYKLLTDRAYVYGMKRNERKQEACKKVKVPRGGDGFRCLRPIGMNREGRLRQLVTVCLSSAEHDE